MENLNGLTESIFQNTMNPCFCLQILEYGEDPLVRFAVGNNEFEKLSGGKFNELKKQPARLDAIDLIDDYVAGIIRSAVADGEERNGVTDSFFPGKTYKIKVFIPEKGYVCIILADVTEYKNARNEIQKMYEFASSTAEQLKYKVDLLTVTQDELKRINRIHEIMFGVSSDGFFYKNYATGVFYAADSFYDLFTYDGIRPIDNTSIINAMYEQDVFSYARTRESAVSSRSPSVTKEMRLLDGVTWLETNLKFIYDEKGSLIEEIGFFKDITTVKKQQEELAYRAYYDSMTGLMNRNYFTGLLEDDISRMKADEGEIQVIYIDIDDLKKINDGIGFQLGDRLLLEFARRLRGLENEKIRIARFDSDEFVISIYDGTRNDANNVCRALRKLLERAFDLGRGISCLMTVSIGVAEYPSHGACAVDVLSNADIAVHHIKNNGKNSVAFFEERMLEQLLSKIEMEKTISYALENDSFMLYYQPQYYTETKELRGFEALIRMKDDKFGVVSPGSFIPVAEKNGSIVEIGEWVINQALEDYNSWHKEYGFSGIISINISTVQFRQVRFEGMLYKAVEKYNIDPTRVEIEITESVFADNQAQLIEMVKRIREKGIKVSLDDFGTGYSSLSYLKNFPVDTLKIDKSFIDYLGKEKKSDIIISSLVEMMRNLGLEIIAEGVETKDQYDILKKLHCDNIQGFYLGKPMNSNAIEAVIRKGM